MIDINNQNKGFVIVFKKNEWGGNSYTFEFILKTSGDLIITEGQNFQKNIKNLKGVNVIEARNSNNSFVNIINSAIIPNSEIQLETEYFNLQPERTQVALKIGANCLGEILGNKMMTEEELLSKLYNIFNNTRNIVFEHKEHPYRNATIYCLNAHLLPELNNLIEPTDDVVKSIMTPGKIQAEQNQASVTNVTKAKPAKDSNNPENAPSISQLDPDDIIEKIRQKIIAQDKTIEDVVDTLFLNQELISLGDPDLLNTSKANILIDGPTGTGKTFLLKELSSHMSLPLVITSATSFSTVGYKGNDLESILIKLLDEANGDLSIAERGIVVIDEFDKLGTSNQENELAIRKGLQEELLSYLSGAKFIIKYKNEDVEFDTSKITFVGIGAFTNLRERKIKENEKKSNIIGFGSNAQNSNDERTYNIEPEDYISEGIMREFIGRFTTITHTNALTKEDLVKLMKESATSPLLSTKKIVALHGKELMVNDDVLEYIAEIVLQMNTGARGLQTIFNPINRALLREMRSKDNPCLEITIDLVESLQEAKVRRY